MSPRVVWVALSVAVVVSLFVPWGAVVLNLDPHDAFGGDPVVGVVRTCDCNAWQVGWWLGTLLALSALLAATAAFRSAWRLPAALMAGTGGTVALIYGTTGGHALRLGGAISVAGTAALSASLALAQR